MLPVPLGEEEHCEDDERELAEQPRVSAASGFLATEEGEQAPRRRERALIRTLTT
jgi:hypothetical protein